MKPRYDISRPGVNGFGDRVWKTDDGNFHHYEGPSREATYEIAWFIRGRLHRLDGPAYIHRDGGIALFLDGSLQ